MKCPGHPLFLFLLFFSFLLSAQSTATPTKYRTSDPNKSIVSNTKNDQNYSMLSAVIKATNLNNLLDYDGPYTIFAPSDKAFDKLPNATKKNLLKPENKKKLYALMTGHMVSGKLSASNILREMCRGGGKATFTTVSGDTITATMDGIDILLTDVSGHVARITVADSNQCNGVIHGIDSVILPIKI